MNWMELLISWSLTLLVALTPLSIDAAEVDPLPKLFDRALALSVQILPQLEFFATY